MTDEEIIKYGNLYKNLYSIYTYYDKAIEKANNTLYYAKKGSNIDDKSIDEDKIENLIQELTNSKNIIHSLLKQIKEKENQII